MTTCRVAARGGGEMWWGVRRGSRMRRMRRKRRR
jgi:hypothetical protein